MGRNSAERSPQKVCYCTREEIRGLGKQREKKKTASSLLRFLVDVACGLVSKGYLLELGLGKINKWGERG